MKIDNQTSVHGTFSKPMGQFVAGAPPTAPNPRKTCSPNRFQATRLGCVENELSPAPATGQDLSGIIDEPEMLRRIPISRRGLHDWKNTGKIPYIKMGRRVLYHWPSVEAALLRQQKEVA